MGVVVFVSGPSGAGKTTICKTIAEDLKFTLIHQDSYFVPNEKKPLVMLSDGSEARNWDTYQSIDFEKFNRDILKARFASQFVIVEGFCLPESLMKVVPDLHIHLSYVESERINDTLNVLGTDLLHKMLKSRESTKLGIKNDYLMLKEIVIPFYINNLCYMKIDYIVPVFIDGERVKLNLLTSRISELMASVTY